LNRLVTPFDNPVVTTTSQATTSTKGKIVYVATADETPVTLYITPGANQDIALSLTLIPKRIPAREIHLSLDKDTYQVLTKLQQQISGQGTGLHYHAEKAVPRSGAAKNTAAVFPARAQSRGKHPLSTRPGADSHRPAPGRPGYDYFGGCRP
jgi:hypothetical protein